MAEYYNAASIEALDKRVRTNFINSLSGFKSANLVATKGHSGIENIAMISSAFHVGAHPPLLGILMRPHTVPRHTLQNIKDTGYFTLNHVHEGMVEQAHQCAANYGVEQSEFEACGLTAYYTEAFAAPYIQQSRIKLGLELREIQVLNINLTELVIAEIVEVITDKLYQTSDGYLDIESAGSVSVSGLDSYHSSERIDRFSYAKPDTQLHSIWKNE
jgi:flavin reductase (DIM6/NTAB) family NADH-FMN oxidoreductase RutF